MAFLNIPLKSITVDVTDVISTQTMPWYNPADFPVPPGQPTPEPVDKDFRWRLTLGVVDQLQSSYITRAPGNYDGIDISVGLWLGNLQTGQAWQIISVESKTQISATIVVQDVYRYNTFRDPTQQGNGGPPLGVYVVFSVNDTGTPLIDPVPVAGVSSQFSANLLSRFEYINLQYDYPLYQANNTFEVNDVIAANSNINGFTLSDSNNRLVVGRVTSISDTVPGWFTVNPVQKVVDYLDSLPGVIGSIIYTSLDNPGELTTEPGGSEIYLKLRNNTQSFSYSSLPGPTAAGNVFQLNETNVTVLAPGDMQAVVDATNTVIGKTGVVASLELTPTSAVTNSANVTPTYGEPLLWASSNYAQITINGILVTFDITSTQSGYSDYARPTQMAESINNAGIGDIVASTSNNGTKLVITNTAGGAINIVNVTDDVNGIAFGGANSGSGVPLSTAASTTYRIEFLATDARPINFLNVIGSPVDDFGLMSVENGVKACGLYIAQGLRTSTSTVVTNLAALNSLSPLIGDQAYVIDSDDGDGNNVGEWSMWIYDGVEWIETGNQDSATTDAKSIEYTVDYTTTSPIEIGKISTGRRVTLITVEVLTAFDSNATLALGYSINNPDISVSVPSGLMDSGLIDLTVEGTYTTQTDILFGTDTVSGDVTITGDFDSDGSTQGVVQIIVSYV